jgi:glycosyltransferase involved in cell wall biosynthesis
MQSEAPPVAYALKVYPRLTQTFVVNELLAHEAAAQKLAIYSLRRPKDPRFHPSLAQVQTPVAYLPEAPSAGRDWWNRLRADRAALPALFELAGIESESPEAIFCGMALARELRQAGALHVHAHFGGLAASAARIAARLCGLPWSFTAHARDIFHESVDEVALQQKLASATCTITVSRFNRDYLVGTLGAPAERVHVVYNGIDLAALPLAAPAAPEREPLIVGVGRLIEKKGFCDLVAACARLRERGVAFRCEIVGSGPLEAELLAQIGALGLGDRVRLCGALTQAEALDRMRRAALVAAPCVVAGDGDRDGLPTVLLEALALGRAAISTPVTGIPELIADGETGLLVPPGDPESLARGIERLLRDPELRSALGARGRARMERDFDIHRNAARQRALWRGASETARVRPAAARAPARA